MAVTDFPDTFLVVDGLVVAAVIIVDLWCSQDTRLAVAERARARLALLKETPTADLIARSSARLHLASTALFGRSALRWRFVALALIASAGLGGVALFAGALVSAPDPGAAIAHAIRFFALPAVACGSLSLDSITGFLVRWRASPRSPFSLACCCCARLRCSPRGLP